MVNFIFLFLLVSSYSFAKRYLGGSMFGDKMAVSYIELDSKKHILIVKEKTGMNANKAVFKEHQIIELNLKNKEYVSLYAGFRCDLNNSQYVLGVISSERAKENGTFMPERAWSIDEKQIKLHPISDLKTVSCRWSPEGEGVYPFK